jgi:hypothetical protein
MEKFKHLQTAEDVQKALYEIKATYESDRKFLVEEYERLFPIKKGDKVNVIQRKFPTETGGLIGFELMISNRIIPIIHKLKKDNTISSVGRIYVWSEDVTIEKIK